MREELVKRINELAAKAKKEGLTAAEEKERAELRAEYLREFRAGFEKNILSNLYVVDEKGNKTKVERRKGC